jgi:spermidine synthase
VSQGVAYRLRFLSAVVLPAAVLMALEIVSSRLLAPAFGNSVYVWGSIIGVFLAAMSGGYVLGGTYADRMPQLAALAKLLLLAALFQWGTAIFGRSAVAAIGEATGGRPAGTLLATALLFGPATLLLATVSPFAVRLAGLERERLGNVSGKLFALSTAGSLVGTLLATFFLIPAMGLDTILALLVSATAGAAALAAGRGATLIAALAIGLTCWASPALSPDDDSVLAERATPYQTLVVRESGGVRTLTSDGTTHGATVLATGEPAMRYVHTAQLLKVYAPQARRLAILGMGSGSVGRLLAARTPGLEATYVDIDPAVPEIASRWFGLAEGPRERVVIEDARRFLASRADLWDWIYCDTYIGRAVPFHLATEEFFRLVKSRLAPGGALGVNMAGSVEHLFGRAMLRTMGRVFDRVEIYSVRGSGNFFLLAHDGVSLPEEELRARAAALDREGVAQQWTGPRFAELVARKERIDLDLATAPVLVDGYAPVDALLNFADEHATLPKAPGPE